MTNQSTIDKLIKTLLTTMANACRNQLDNPKLKDIPFEDQFGILVDIEYGNRKTSSQETDKKCRIQSAGDKYHG